MGLLDNLERGLEKAVQSAFSAGGSRAVKPVEIANALRLTMDDEAMVLSEGRTFVPNVFIIRFSTPDFELARKWGSALAEELCDEAIRHARDQGYTLHGPVRVTFVEEASLRAGKLDIESASDRSGGSDQMHDAGSSPSGTGSAAVVDQAPVDRNVPVPPVPPVTSSPAPRPAPSPAAKAVPVRRTPSPSPQQPAQPAAAPLQPVLEIDGRKYGINADSIVLGRSADADILVEDTGVSRRHLEIITRGSTVMAVDLGSTNGIYVNDRKVDGSTVLRHGDRITMGRVAMVFRMLPARDSPSQGGAS
ncbi:FHA domain-containing protein [Citricoccus nitrophenolicus]